MDKWTIIGGNKDNQTILLVISGVESQFVVSIASLQPFSTTQEALPKLRAKVVEQRNAILAAAAIPAMVQSAIGYTEDI
jgi:hypothetical protein